MTTINLNIDDKKVELLDLHFGGFGKSGSLKKYLEDEIESLVKDLLKEHVSVDINEENIQTAIDTIEQQSL